MIDLRSDTVTTPTASMREAAAEADVGDDVYGEDPSVNALESTAAELLGMEEALFVPSGTMANQIAALSHTDPGQSVVVERHSHIYGWEGGGLAYHARLQAVPLDGGARGLYTSEQLRSALIEPEIHRADTGLIAIENTHNHAGGVALSPKETDPLCDVAAEYDIPIHLDGARLFNAAVSLDLDPATVADGVDSVMCSLSKGLGAPVGSMLAGSRPFIETARKHRKRLGGGMRQAGILAAPALLGLSDWERLAADHRRAAQLADAIAADTPLGTNDPDTNIVLVDVSPIEDTPEEFVNRCRDAGVLSFPFGETTIRFCTHHDVDDNDIERAISIIADLLD